MSINRQFQDLHSREPTDTDWVAIQLVERDVCLLYHQLADYSYIMGDLYYGNVFGLSYWDYLQVDGLEPEKAAFIRNGCLVMLYAMASEVIDGSGAYLTMDPARFGSAKTALDRLPSIDDDTDKLADAVRRSLCLAEADSPDPNEIRNVEALSTWIHKTFVRVYFTKRANDFEKNPYFHDAVPE